MEIAPSVCHVVNLPATEFKLLDRVWKMDNCDPDDYKEYVVLGINWVCTRLKNGVPNDGYWEYEVSAPTGMVSRVNVAEDWLINESQLKKQKQRYEEDRVWQLEQAEDRGLYIEHNGTKVYFQQELYM